jgi:hypothetical protein
MAETVGPVVPRVLEFMVWVLSVVRWLASERMSLVLADVKHPSEVKSQPPETPVARA